VQLIRHLSGYEKNNPGLVIAIGNFDGVHLGHQKIIHKAIELAKANSLEPAVMLFEPHPQEFFNLEAAPSRLTHLREKFCLLRELGINQLFCLKFNQKFSELDAQNFIKEILIQHLNSQFIIVGEDFRFGHQKNGNIHLLAELSQSLNYEILVMPEVIQHGKRVSSTVIRHLLDKGEVESAAELLGRPYSLSGKVVRGDQRGRLLGFPTANIILKSPLPPVRGVYAVEVHGLHQPLKGVSNIGIRPTIGGQRCLLETYLFDFNQEIYGQRLQVYLKHKIRHEKKFANLEQLRQQIATDIHTAREYFKKSY